MPQNDRQRQAAAPRDIADIDPEQDVRVRILGTVLDLREDSMIVDDGSGTTEVFLNEELKEAVHNGMRVRVLGRVLPTPDSFEIQGEIVQDMADLDMDLYKTVKETVSRPL